MGFTSLGERSFSQPIAKPKSIGPEYNPWYWHPFRAGVKTCPERIQTELDRIAPGLAITWNPIRERWMVWESAPRIQHPICQGWKLLFIHQDENGDYLPLDERVYARLYGCSVMANGSAKAYLARVIDEMEHDREAAARKAD